MHFLCLLLITASPEGLDLEGWYWGRGGRWEGQGSVSPQFDVCIASRPLKKKKRLLKMFINFQHLFQKKKKKPKTTKKPKTISGRPNLWLNFANATLPSCSQASEHGLVVKIQGEDEAHSWRLRAHSKEFTSIRPTGKERFTL